MKNSTFYTGNIFGLFVLLLLFTLSHTGCGDAEEVEIKNTPQIDTLLGYSIVSYEITQINHHSYYSDVAVLCDNIGPCDSVNFTCQGKPKLGCARFCQTYNEKNKPSGWMLIKQ